MSPATYLTELEIAKIQAFNEDVVLKNAIRKVLLEPLYNHGVLGADAEHDPTKNFALTPAFNMLMQKREMWDMEKLGMFTMANAMAIQMLEQGFGALEGLKATPESEEVEEDINPN